MLLAGDIGGTKTHLALFEESARKEWKIEQKFKSSNYENLINIIQEFLANHKTEGIKIASFGIAGPVQDGICRATNLPWIVDSKKIAETLKMDHVFLINDLEANAWGLRCLDDDELFVLNEGKKEQKGNGALISAGTGLGEAGLFWDGEKHIPFACEGGHCGFAPEDDLEVHLLRYLHKQYEHVSYERVLSGPGLYHLYRFFIDNDLEREKQEVKKAMEKEDPPRVVTEMALKSQCPACMRALDLFVSIYGSEAGNLALKMYSLGGVFIGGGIAPKILNELKEGDFMTRFIRKGRFTSLMLSMPVKVVLNENTALLGAAEYAREKTA